VDHQVQPLIAALSLAALLACTPDEPPPLTTRSGPATPLVAGPGQLASSEGHLRITQPLGPGWDCSEERHGEGPAAAVALRCRRSDPSELLFLAAKTHRQPPDQRVDARTLLMSLYRADNEGFFASLRYRSDGPLELAGTSGWVAELDATHERYGEVRKREALALVGERVFAISAEGRPALWETHGEAIERWFATVEFAP
jgi:hypothetical protein